MISSWDGGKQLTMCEVDRLVHTEGEVNLDRLEKHILLWRWIWMRTHGKKAKLSFIAPW
jgi:hypothetical protein